MPTAIAPPGPLRARPRPRRRSRRSPIVDAVEDLRARAEPRAGADRRRRVDRARLLEHRPRRIAEVVIAADHVAVRRDQRVARRSRTRLAEKTSQLKPMLAPSSSVDVAVLARQDRVAADEHAVADRDAAIRVALGVEQAVVVDDDVVADADLVRMAQHDVLAEDDVAAAGAEQQRIERLAQREAERARHALRRAATTSSCLTSARQPGPADDERRDTSRAPTARLSNSSILARWRVIGVIARCSQFQLRSSRCSRYHAASGGCRRAGRPAARSRARVARAADVERAALGEEVDAAAVERRLDAERRADRLAQRRRRSRTATPAGAARGGGTPASSAIDRDELVQRRHFPAGEDVGPAGGRRHLAAQPEALDQIVDVGQMVEDPAGAEDRRTGAARRRETASAAGDRRGRRSASAARSTSSMPVVARPPRARAARLRASCPGRRRPG